MANQRLREGDVVRVTQYNYEHCHPPRWCIATTGQGMGGAHVLWLTGPHKEGRSDHYLAADMQDDTYTVPSVDEWPDEVCAAVAQRRLMGEIR